MVSDKEKLKKALLEIEKLKKKLAKNNLNIVRPVLKKIPLNTRKQVILRDVNTGKIAVLNNKNIPLIKQQFKVNNQPITNKDIQKLRNNELVGNLKASNFFPPNSKIQTQVRVRYTATLLGYNYDIGLRENDFNYTGSFSKKVMKRIITQKLRNHFSTVGCIGEFQIHSITPLGTLKNTNQEIKALNMKMRDVSYLKIFNSELINHKVKDGDNCVKSYLTHYYKSIKNIQFHKSIEALPTEPTPKDVNDWCVRWSIKSICYNRNKQIICKTMSKSRKFNSLIYMSYCNHLYPIDNKYIKKVDINKNVIIVNNVKESLIKLLDQQECPENVSTSTLGIIYSYEDSENIYVENNEYNECLEILTKLGLEDKIKATTKLSNISKIIENQYIKKDINSVWFSSNDFGKCGFNYNSEQNDCQDEILTIDKNLCHSFHLAELPFLSIINDVTSIITDGKNVKEIVPHYWYNVAVKESTILLPDNNMYIGYNLIKCKKICPSLKFKIIQEITAEKIDNYYTEMIQSMLKLLGPTITKKIMNRCIGRFQLGMNVCDIFNFEKIGNYDETRTMDCHKTELNDDYNMMHTLTKYADIHTRKPIAFQILDSSRIGLYERMIEMNITNDEVIQIKTDAITFKKGNRVIKTEEYDASIFEGWKLENYVPIKNSSYTNTLHDYNIDCFNKNELHQGYAGAGKTYEIINKIKNMKDYIVLTPSHATIVEYRKLKHINCNVIQYYEFNNSIPEESIIIVDEVGMLSMNAMKMLIKCYMLGKQIICYGDFKQLLPVKSSVDFSGSCFINTLFNLKTNNTDNYRNMFTIDYYDSLINKTCNIQYEVRKHSSINYYDAEYIICYRRETTDKYNKLMLKHLKYESIEEVGCRVMCVTNDLRDDSIYNNFIFKVTSNHGDKIELDNGIKITKKQFHKNFKAGYAVTLYCIQGQSVKSYYYPSCDKFFINSRSAYTLISRLKTDKCRSKMIVEKNKNEIRIKF